MSKQKEFPVLTICRDDLEEFGFDTSNVKDDTMERLASELCDEYIEQIGENVERIADNMEIPRRWTSLIG